MRYLPAILFLFAAACGGSGSGSSAEIRAKTGEGYAALGKGDAQTALSKFDAALVGLDSTNPEFLRASLGRCEALAKTDGEAAKKAFLDLVAKVPAEIGEDDYGLVCSRLIEGGFIVTAIEVMHEGIQRFPGSKKMATILDAVKAAAARASDPAALKALDSLGYT